jgi:two-component system, chemotaxis family, chemotaxis protein CheY
MTERILIADSSRLIRKNLTRVLVAEGYDVIEASDGPEALKKMISSHVDLVICDMNMATMDGISFVKKMCSDVDNGNKSVRSIIMMATESGEDKKNEGRDAGVNVWLTKPFSLDSMVETVKKVLSQ